jgi:hypothetical protein
MNVNEFKVSDRRSFVKFVQLLRQDLSTNKDAWENNTLESFLEALSAYAEDIQGYYNNHKSTDVPIDADVASWETFSDIFKGARIYE